jgi:hypothetical protein
MNTLYTHPDKPLDDNIQAALETFSFLNEITAENLVLWLHARPSLSGVITESELETLEGIVW